MKPRLRIVHNLARSGSTLMCKCLGCMDGVALLSEIHPAAGHLFNPLQQAQEWFGLLTQADRAALAAAGGRIGFADAIALIARRCGEQGRHLVLRDWAHLDFTGVPFLDRPGYRLSLYEGLKGGFDILRVATVRHPIDQWLSLGQLALFQAPMADGRLTVEGFLDGYLRFARLGAEFGFVRYEDFTRNPNGVMADLCSRLDVPFDPAFIDRWHRYTTITGDVRGTRGGTRIKPLTRRADDPALLERFRACPAHGEALALLGYDD